MNYKFPLQTDPFTIWDRLKASWFILNKNNKLTIGPKVDELEHHFNLYSSGGNGDIIATSSGSTAIHLLVECFIQTYNYDPKNVVVFAPATTWASSITPWIMRGCKIEFVDINLNDFSFDYEELEKKLIKYKNTKKVKVIWPTALIGFIFDVDRLRGFSEKYETYLFADLCECTIGQYKGKNILSCFDMAVTSLFWAHEVCGIECGLLFCPDYGYNTFARMIRSHGLTRALRGHSDQYVKSVEGENPYIDPEFLFYKIGTNFRPTDLNAYFALLDFKRIEKYEKHRSSVWNIFNFNLSPYYKNFFAKNCVPFCLPIIFRDSLRDHDKDFERLRLLKGILNNEGFETRPVISFLPMSPAFRKLVDDGLLFPNSKFLHFNGCYVGLSNHLKGKDVKTLVSILNHYGRYGDYKKFIKG
jgi:CDP-6-deoxy-D-xylo-4-hexulose-3-dehydrase